MASKKTKRKAAKLKFELTRASLLLWSLIFLVFLGWIFALGIVVGKGMLPQSVKATISAPFDKLRDLVPGKENRELDRSKLGMEDPELTFYRKLSSKKEEAARRERASVQREADRKTAETGSLRESEPADQGRTYTVQLASLDREESAEGLVGRLKGRGYPAYFYRVKLDGRDFYRVRCGSFGTLADALKMRQEVAKTEGLAGLVIRTDNR